MTTVPPPSAPFGAPAPVDADRSPSRRRRVIGAMIALAGIVAAIVCLVLAGQRADDGVTSLARAAVGCDTTLDFAEPGDYLVFVETRGELPAVRGDCERSGVFDLAADEAPAVDIRIIDPDGAEAPLLARRGRESYDRAGSTGDSLARVTISEAGDHVVRVESASSSTFAVAIGRDPSAGVGALRLAGLTLGAIGLFVGALVAFAGRRRTAEPPPTSAPTVVAGVWGAPPPTGPPPMQTPAGPPAAPGWPVAPPGQGGPPMPARQPTPPPGSWAPDAGSPAPPASAWSPDGAAPVGSWPPEVGTDAGPMQPQRSTGNDANASGDHGAVSADPPSFDDTERFEPPS